MFVRSLRSKAPVSNFSHTKCHRCMSGLTADVADLVQKYTRKRQTSASLQILMRTGRGELLERHNKRTQGASPLSPLNEHHQATERILLQVASFIRREMPIRLAHRIQDLDRVPLLNEMPSVQDVKQIYISSFLQLASYPLITTIEQEDAFATKLEQLYENHSNVLIQMAKGAYELREAVRAEQGQNLRGGKATGMMGRGSNGDNANNNLDFARLDACHSFLDRFYMSRIGIRVLAGQYLALRGEPLPHYIGMICSQTSPYEVVQYATHDATHMCEREYGVAPELEIKGRLDLTFPYIPTHLHYILLELLKNAMRATMDKHGDEDDLPPVQVIIADGTENEDVVIKVADQGGGIKRSEMDKIWSYLFTTADPAKQEAFFHAAMQVDSPLAGLGYGLPISRSYARYFGGDLDVMSMEGYGTDAFVYLTRLGDSKEPLPV